MGQESTSKTKESKTPDPILSIWIVTGEFTFSPNGTDFNQVKCSIVVKAEGAHGACVQALDRMGAKPIIKRVQQMEEE